MLETGPYDQKPPVWGNSTTEVRDGGFDALICQTSNPYLVSVLACPPLTPRQVVISACAAVLTAVGVGLVSSWSTDTPFKFATSSERQLAPAMRATSPTASA